MVKIVLDSPSGGRVGPPVDRQTKGRVMIRTYQRIQRRRAAGEIEGGFTLIELLIVIVVLGILAAIVVFALGGVTGKSTAAACQSDAKTVGVGVAALMAENPSITSLSQLTDGSGTGDTATVPGWEFALTATGTTLASKTIPIVGNPFLQSWPNSTSYSISVADGTTPTAASVHDASATSSPPALTNAPAFGDVIVTGKGSGAAAYSYDATVNPIEACNWAVLGHS